MEVIVDSLAQEVWIKRLQSGDVEAFEYLYNAHKLQLAMNLFKLLKCPQAVEDVLQDVFVKVWENRTELDPNLSFAGFLHRIASNKVIDFYRKSSRSNAYRTYLQHYAEMSYQHVDRILERKESKELLDKALNILSPQCRQVYQLCKVEGRSYQEVSNILQISPNTVSVHLNRAHKKLQVFFKDPVNLPYLLLILWGI